MLYLQIKPGCVKVSSKETVMGRLGATFGYRAASGKRLTHECGPAMDYDCFGNVPIRVLL